MANVISNIRHPDFNKSIEDWSKWRRCYQGGKDFKSAFLYKFSSRESDDDFEKRQQITPIPRFAGAAIDEIKNSIFQRMIDIGRNGGSKTYQDAINGKSGGVDNEGSSMNMFIGQYVLPELMVMSKVGVFVDAPEFSGVTIAEQGKRRPYLYLYTAEEIRSWSTTNVENETYLTNLLLRDTKVITDEETGLVSGSIERFRHLWLDKDGFVNVQFWDWSLVDNKPVLSPAKKKVLNLTKIPFVLFELDKSLMEDIADYQIALLNMESSDINYSLNANFVFYTEEYDQRETATHLKDGTDEPGKVKEIKVGTTHGRRRPRGLAEPKFIHPSREPLDASMAKQDQILDRIRKLVGLALSTVQPIHASAESKSADQGTLEAGLSGIGLELENGERRIAEIWADFESSKIATVNYPRKYSLKTDAERREEAKQQKELQGAAPSNTYQKEVAKQIADTMLNGKVSDETLKIIKQQIDDAKYITSDPDAISKDVENGLVSKTTASNARGYLGGSEVPEAKKEHTELLAEIAKSQSTGLGQARGVVTEVGKGGSKQEKKNKNRRGTGKKIARKVDP